MEIWNGSIEHRSSDADFSYTFIIDLLVSSNFFLVFYIADENANTSGRGEDFSKVIWWANDNP